MSPRGKVEYGHHVMPSIPSTPWLRDLYRELYSDVGHEVALTLGVAVCKAAKMTHAEMVRRLGITDVEAKMAQQRLVGVASRWSQT